MLSLFYDFNFVLRSIRFFYLNVCACNLCNISCKYDDGIVEQVIKLWVVQVYYDFPKKEIIII